MQVEQLLNNPIRTEIHTHAHCTHSILQDLCLQKGQQLVGETSPESRKEEIHGHHGGGQQVSEVFMHR